MSTQTASRIEKQDDTVEEIYYRKGDIDFCFLLNREHQNLRVFDYRVGNYQQKRDFFDRIARSENLRKVFTVVEKQDSKSWRSVGFSREGAIPGYFRTADAYIMSRVYTEDGDPIQGGAPKLNVQAFNAKETTPTKPRGMTPALESDEDKLADLIEKYGIDALYAPFRRGIFRPDIAASGTYQSRELWVGAETDSSFGHAKLDVLTPVTKESEVPATAYLMQFLLDELARQATASVFSMVAADDRLSNILFAGLGFKVTARLTDHIVREDDFVGIQLWHRRITPQTSR